MYTLMDLESNNILQADMGEQATRSHLGGAAGIVTLRRMPVGIVMSAVD